MANRTCAIDQCDRMAVKRSWCNRHYQRWHRHGTTDLRTLSHEERFWAKVNKTETCWLWTGTRWGKRRKYGQFQRGPRGAKKMQAHRCAYELVRGPIPEGLEIDHLCRVTLCVNPDHLEAVTPEENRRRARNPG